MKEIEECACAPGTCRDWDAPKTGINMPNQRCKAVIPAKPEESKPHSHYFKYCPYQQVDVYRVLELFGVTDPCLQHVAKKALVAGGRGHKDIGKDVQDMIDSLRRWQQMRHEEQDRVAMSELK